VSPVFVAGGVLLLLALLPLAAVAMRATPEEGLVALELGGAVTTLAVVCLAVGLDSTAVTGLAVVTAVMTWAGGLVFARFLERAP